MYSSQHTVHALSKLQTSKHELKKGNRRNQLYTKGRESKHKHKRKEEYDECEKEAQGNWSQLYKLGYREPSPPGLRNVDSVNDVRSVFRTMTEGI